ncbi:unnamed protein product [Orchesella dallaii]|uniref:Uncharacterized protein n=1 Tax=Orchesella dallaii TaxID=48710 RepID=A0ABP1PST6_9HEXA
MGDIVYPGVVLTRLNPKIRREDVEDYVYTRIGSSPALYRTGNPEVIVYRPSEETNDGTSTFRLVRALISGILLPLNIIRLRFGSYLLLGQQVFVQTPDMGVPRKNDGELYTERKFLHNHLVEGQGNLSPIPILHAFIDAKLGNIKSLKSTILYEETKNFVHIDELRNSGSLILYGNTDRGCVSEKKSYTRMEVVFETRFDALQAISRLNLNASFSTHGKPSYFLLDENSPRCTLTMQTGLGLGGSILNVKMLMQRYGYVPLDTLNGDVFKISLLRRMKKFCVDCNSKYVIIGVGSNLDWLAARCDCPTLESPFTWKGENFFRIFCWPNNEDKPVLRISRGLIPLYEDDEEFTKTAYAAFKNEFHQHSKQLKLTNTYGTVSMEEIVEVATFDSAQYTMQMLRIVVPKTKFWSYEGYKAFKEAKLIRRTEDKQAWNYDHPGIKSTMYEINAIPASSIPLSEVVLVAVILRHESKFQIGEEVLILPLPIQTEKNALKKALNIWRNYVRVVKQPNKFLPATLSSYFMCKTLQSNEGIRGKGFYHQFFAWQFIMKTNNSPTWTFLTEQLPTCYVGLNVVIKLNDRPARNCVARITGIYESEMDYVVIEMIMFLNVTKIHNVSKSVEYQAWIMSQPIQDVPQKLLSLALNDDDATIANNLSPSDVAVFEDTYVEVGDIENLTSVISSWRQRPNPIIPLLDLLMHPRNPDGCFQASNVLRLPPTNSYREVHCMLKFLNHSQRTAVDAFFGNMLSLIQGPPGSGKTSTIAVGVLALHTLANGIVIASCQSNYATNVLFEAVVKKNQNSFKTPKTIIRMLSFSQEHIMTRLADPSSNNYDQYYLHIKVRDHPKWKENEEIDRILSKKRLQGEALLTIAERTKLREFVSEITSEILASADVIICTVRCISDGRIFGGLRQARSIRRKLVGMVVDEASLLTVPSVLPILVLKPLRICLVGDDSQLSPTVTNESSKVACLDVSWFEFLRLTPYGKKPGCVTMLDVQFRMPAPSAQLISSFMYHDLLQSDASVHTRNYSGNIYDRFPQLRNIHSAWFSYDAYGEQQDEGSVSYYNIIEANIIHDILLKLHDSEVLMGSVTIIAMYERQVEHIKAMVNRMGQNFEVI